jgi:hypothetical protein
MSETFSISFTTDGTEGYIGEDLAIRFRSDTSTAVYYDNIEVTAVPEPSTFALIGACLALTSIMLRRRRD